MWHVSVHFMGCATYGLLPVLRLGYRTGVQLYNRSKCGDYEHIDYREDATPNERPRKWWRQILGDDGHAAAGMDVVRLNTYDVADAVHGLQQRERSADSLPDGQSTWVNWSGTERMMNPDTESRAAVMEGDVPKR